MPRVRLSRFEVATPSLEEIFIAKVGTETLARLVAEWRALNLSLNGLLEGAS